MNETMKGNMDLIAEKIPSVEPFSFPNPFTEKEQEFLKEAMDYYQKATNHYRCYVSMIIQSGTMKIDFVFPLTGRLVEHY